jgi:hypothetical protein
MWQFLISKYLLLKVTNIDCKFWNIVPEGGFLELGKKNIGPPWAILKINLLGKFIYSICRSSKAKIELERRIV